MDQWNPNQYDKFKNERSQPFYDLMNLLEPKPQCRVVDLGCGTGELTQVLHKTLQASDTLGVDSSAKMLEKAKALSGDGLSFTEADISSWRPNVKPDILFSNAALQWCPDHEKLFARLAGYLEGSGQMAIQMPMNQDYPTHTIAAQMNQESPWRELLSGTQRRDEFMLKPDEYASQMYALGFTVFKVFIRVYGHELESREAVVEWVKGTLLTHYQSRLPADRFQEFLIEFKRRLFLELPDQRPFFFPFKRILIWGKF